WHWQDIRSGEEHHDLQPRAHEHAATWGEGYRIRDLPRRYTVQRLGDAAGDEPSEDAAFRCCGSQSAIQLPLDANRSAGRRCALQELWPCAQISSGFRLPAARFPLPQAGWRYGDYPAA